MTSVLIGGLCAAASGALLGLGCCLLADCLSKLPSFQKLWGIK